MSFPWWHRPFSSRKRSGLLPSRVRLSLEILEDRLAPTGNITMTGISLVNSSDVALASVNAGEEVYVQAEFTTQGLPASASYRVGFTVNGLTLDTGYITSGAGAAGPQSWFYYWGYFIATPGINQVSVTVDPDQSVAETTYADNTVTSTFNAAVPAVGGMTYTVAQIRAAYGISSIPNFGAATADGSGQTIAIVDAYNDPTIITDLDGFDQAMSMTTSSATPTLYQEYGPASSILTVYNQTGTNITADIGTSGSGGVPAEDPTGSWEGEETMDVEWAHAIAPGAKIDLIETDGTGSILDDLLAGDAIAGALPGVSVVSNSWIWSEWSGETAYDLSTFVTPAGHTGVTFLASTGDGGTPGGYPAFSPNVVAVGATELTLDNNAYAGETAWSFPTPSTLDNGSSSYSQTGSWATQSDGFSGNYSTATVGSTGSATWTTSITSADQGWVGGTEVSATWTASPSNATNATYTIYDGTEASGTVLGTVVVNQQLTPLGTVDGSSQFQELGDFYPTSGTLTVVLNANGANGTVVADAVGIAPAWATAGGQSQVESEPSYQLPFQSTGQRTTPDVSFDGSDNSGVTCYQNGSIGYDYFGTSLSSPCWAGLIAIVNQGRVAGGGTTLNSVSDPTQTLQALYSLPASDFNDITSGYNGLFPTTGYDEVTGRGSLIANTLVPDLVSYSQTVSAISFIDQPTSTTAGATLNSITVQAVDANGDPVDNATITIGISSGAVSGTLTATTDWSGVATFSNLSDDLAGTCSLSASTTGIANVASNSFTISAAGLATLAFEQQPSSTSAGSSLGSVVVQADDRYGNAVSGVSVSLTLSAGTLGGTTTAVTNAAGQAAFSNLTVDQLGTYTLTATSAPASQTSSSFVITAGAPSKVTYITEPTGTTAGSTLNAVTVQVADAFGNVIAGTAVSIALTAGSLTSGTTPLTTNAAGQVVFSDLVEDTAGTYTLSATVAGVSAVLSDAFVITNATAANLAFVTSPSNTTAGNVINPVTVRVVDAFGNVVAGEVVGVAISPGSLSSGTTPLTSNAAGQVVFSDLIEDTANTYSLTTSAAGLSSIASGSFVISAAAVGKISYVTQPSSTTAGAVMSAVTVQVTDDFNNVITGATVSISIAPASLSSGTTSLTTDSAGQAVFGNLVEDTTGTYSLTASTAGVAALTSNSFTIGTTAAKLTYLSQPSNAVAGSVLSAVTVKVTDAFGNTVAGTPVSMALSSGSLSAGTTSLTSNASGQVVFNNLIEDKTGTYTLTAAAAGVSNVSSNAFTITPQTSSEALAFISEPSGTAAGTVISAVTVQAADQFGNVIQGVSVGVSLAPHPLSIGTTPIATNAAGQAVFSDLVEDLIGTYTLTASAGGAASIASSSFIITPSTATATLSFVSQPGNVVAGNDIGAVTVKAADKFGNVIAGLPIGIAASPGALTSGTTPLPSNAAGEVVFGDLLEDTAGTYKLTASSTGVTSIFSNSFVVSAAAATAALSITGQPNGTTTAGTVLGDVIVQATDVFGNVVPGIVVGIAISPGTLSAGTTPLTTNASGQASFSDLIEDIAGSYTLTASATGHGSVSSNSFTVTAAAAAKLSFASQPSGTTAGAILNPVIVQAVDRFGNSVAGVDVGIASSPKSLSTGTTPLATGATGQAVFSDLSQDNTGTYTLTASASGLAGVNSQTFIIKSAEAATLTFVDQPSSIAAGATLNAITLSAVDQFGNLVVGGAVSMTLSSGTLGGTTAAITNASGQAVFSSLTVATGGLFTLHAASGSASTVSNPFAVTSSADTITWVVEPAGTGAGTALSAVTVQLSDPSGDLLPNVKINVALVGGTLASGTTTATTNSSGQATFTGLTINAAGTYSLNASATPVPPSPSSSFVITSGSVSKFTFLAQPSTTAAGATMAPLTVKALDQFGNVVSGLVVSLTTNYGTLTGATTATTNAAGVAVFSGLSESVAGTCVLTVSATGASSNALPFTVTSASQSTLSFVSQPISTKAGAVLSPIIVKVTDKFGNAVTGASVSLQISMNTLTGSTVLATNSAGEAVFSNLYITKAGTYTLSASVTGLTKATSNQFAIAPAAGNLSFLTEPVSTSAGSILNAVTVRDLDQYGNPVAGVAVSVRLSSGTLSGTVTEATNTAGEAIFTSLLVSQTATSDTLIASAPGLTSKTSTAFNITAAQPPRSAFTSPPKAATAGATMSSVVVQLENSNGTVLDQANVPVTVKLSTGTLTGTLTVYTNSAGQAIFSTLKIASAGTYTMTAAATVNGQAVSVTSAAFVVD